MTERRADHRSSAPGERPATDGDAAAVDEPMTIDEQFRSLLEGLRTTIPAVQVLFAFLLTAPLQTDFEGFDAVERVSFATAFYASGVASILLVAPSAHQRFRAPFSGLQRHSLRHLVWATWIAIAGSIAALVAITATVFLVSAIVFGIGGAAIASAAVAALAAWSWLIVPVFHFRSRSGDA